MNRERALQVLGVEPGASPDRIKRAYRAQVKLWHPDRYSADSSMRQIAQRNLQDANQAYALLRRGFAPQRTDRPGRQSTQTLISDAARPAVNTQNPSLRLRRLIEVFRAKLRPVLGDMRRVSGSMLLRWFQGIAPASYRPWYRYPPRTSRLQRRNTPRSFAKLLEQALSAASSDRRRVQIHRPRTTHGVPAAVSRTKGHRVRNRAQNAKSMHLGPVDPVEPSTPTDRYSDG